MSAPGETSVGDTGAHGIDGRDGPPVRIYVDGLDLGARQGQTLAAALFAAGRRLWRFTARTGEPRGYFCGVGLCQDCLMTVDGRPNVRACKTVVREGLRAQTQRGLGAWEGGR